jgi:hypothetical protein
MPSDKKENLSLDAVVAEFDKSTEIPVERVREWMRNESIDVLGAVYGLITDERRHYLRIKPNLSREDYFTFIMRYLERCIRENPESKWANSRYAAGWDFVNWFKHYWNDSESPRSIPADLRDGLGKLLKEGDEAVRISIITAILEHLFEDNDIKKYFKEWLADPVLRSAYEEAIGYAAELKKGL